MIARPFRWIASAILLALLTGVAMAVVAPLTLGSLSPSSAQVGVFYSGSITASGGIPPYTYSITAGALPNGLTFSPTTATSGGITISGTPTTSGTFNFTVQVTDSSIPSDPRTSSAGPDSQAAVRRRTLAQSGSPAAGISVSSPFTITVAPAASGAAGAPTSLWTLCMMMAGLAGVGYFRLRQARRG